MTSIADSATATIITLLSAPGGLNATIAAHAATADTPIPPVLAEQFFTDNVSSDIAEKSQDIKYTAIYVYCDKIANTLQEKFRTFSGYAQMVIDVRVSQDRLDGIDRASQLYSESVAQTLNQLRGDWGQGLFYGGKYEISFGPVKHGGRNFLKSVKVTFPVDASID